jgi:tRNA pseudouridine38/39 synthase
MASAAATDGVGSRLNDQQAQEHEQQHEQQQARRAHLASLASRLRALADEAAAAAGGVGRGASATTTTTTISAQLRALAAAEQSDEAVRRRLERLVHEGRAAAADDDDADADDDSADQASKRPRRPPPPAAAAAAAAPEAEGAGNGKKTKKKAKGAAREYDARKYGARRVLLEIAYLGERYRGFARQTPSEAKRAAAAAVAAASAAAADADADAAAAAAAADDDDARPPPLVPVADDYDGTVEGALFGALRRVCLVPPGADPVRALGYSRCGRTDRGVSALGQVVALTLRSAGPPPPPPPPAPAPSPADDAPADNAATALGAATAPVPLTPAHLLPSPDEEVDYAAMLNRALPPDVRVLGWADPPPLLHATAGDQEAEAASPSSAAPPLEFDARFSASYREYLYFFASPHLPGPGAFDVFSPTGGGGGASGHPSGSTTTTAAAAAAAAASAGAGVITAVGSPAVLDVAAMDAAARHLEGEHDFRAFCKLDASGHVRHFVRRVLSARVVPAGAAYSPSLSNSLSTHQTFALRIRGTAFLYHQVRCIAAVLLMVGRGLERPDVVRRLLDVRARPRKPQYALAPEQPLLLYACGYGGGGLDDDDDEEEEGAHDAAAAAAAAPAPATAAASVARPGLACGRIRWHRSARAVQAAEASLGALMQSHLVGAAMAGAMLERVRRDAAKAGAGASGDRGQAAAAAARKQHVPLLERATEPSLDERFRALGIPTDGLDLLEARRKISGGEVDTK